MRNAIKRILVSLLCVTLILGENATIAFSSEIIDSNIYENEADEISQSEDALEIDGSISEENVNPIINESEETESVSESDEKNEETDTEESNTEESDIEESGIEKAESEDVEDEFSEEELTTEQLTAEPLNGATYSLTYIVSDGEATITGYDGTPSGDLVIPDTIEGYPVTRIGSGAFGGCSGFTGELVIPNSVTSIDSCAFEGCSGFSSVSVPRECTIETDAFSGCTNNIIIRDDIRDINDSSTTVSKLMGISSKLGNPRNENGVVTWDCVWFGSYWQNDTNGDGVADKNDEMQPIKWRVLNVDGNDALLVSEKSLGNQSYSEDIKTTWKDSLIRSWLNGYSAESNVFEEDFSDENFMNLAFSDSEIEALLKTEEGITDSIFLLNANEVCNPSYGFDSNRNKKDSKRKTVITPFGHEQNDDLYWNEYWLRDDENAKKIIVANGGNIVDSDTYILNVYCGIRPAIHLDLSKKELYQYAGTINSNNVVSDDGNDIFNMDYDALPFDNSASDLGLQTHKRWFADDYNKYPIERYYEVFSDFDQNMYDQAEDWFGSCFGMVMVSELFNNGTLNKALYPTSNMSEESELGKLIARYQLYQDAESYKNSSGKHSFLGSGEAIKTGDYYFEGSFSDVIDRIRGGENLTVSIGDLKSDPKFSHRLAVDTARGVFKTQKGEWYCIPLYDPNYHDNKERLLFVNTETNQWMMYKEHNSGLIGFSADGTYIDGTSIIFYSESLLSILPKTFNGTEKYINSSAQNASISFSNNDTFYISSADNNRLFEYKNGECAYCAPDFEVIEIPSTDYDMDTSYRGGDRRIIIPSGDYIFSSSKGRLIFNGNNMYRGIVADDGFVASVTSEGELKIHSSTTTNANVCMVNVGETESNHISIATDVEISKEECSLSLKEDTLDFITDREQIYNLSVITDDSEHVIENLSTVNNKHVNLLDESSLITVKLYDNEENGEYKDMGDSFSKAVEINTPYGELPKLNRDNEEFVGWFTEENGGVQVTENTVCTIDQEHILYSRFVPGGLWNVEIEEPEYAGKKVNPRFEVWDGLKLLENYVDYTITFKNNTNAYTLSEGDEGFNPKLAPSITIKSKGNYAGSETVYFKIMPADISGDAFTADRMVIKANNKAQKPVPTLLWNGKSLAAKGNYAISYYKADETGMAIGEPLVSVKDAGEYVIRLAALGSNFVGTKDIPLTVTADKTLVSKLSVGKIVNQIYTGKPLEPELTVKDGKNPLTEGTDYELTYFDNTNVGKACVLIEGKGNYSGVKRVYFSITGTLLSKATISGISAVPYSGNAIKFDDISLYIKETKSSQRIKLREGEDYKVTYDKNMCAGTGTVIFTGINGYTGTVKKTFKITPFILANEPDRIAVELDDSVAYSKGGAKPVVKVRFVTDNGTVKTLIEKTDYSLTYSKNTAVNDCSNPKNLPTVKVTLKGSYSGSISKNFAITPKNIGEVSISVNDKPYQNKKNIYASVPTLTDSDGKKLASGKDYDKTLTYTYKSETTVVNGTEEVVREAGVEVDKNDIIPADTTIKVTAKAKDGGNYCGTVSGEYRITKSNIASAKVTIPAQTYSGVPITLSKDKITIKVGNDTLTSDDFEIVEGSYKNNVKKGTASLTVRGLGNYGGTKTINFTIKAKTFMWWWKY